MPNPTGRRRAKLLPCLVLAVAAALALPATAQQLTSFDSQLALYDDRDASGDLSCGDEMQMGTIIGSHIGATDLTNLTATWPVPDGATLVPQWTIFGHGPESDCTLVSGDSVGDRHVVVFCPFLCRTGGDGTNGTCTQVGLSLGAHVLIDDPNANTELSAWAVATADQIEPSQTEVQVVPFTPCPPASPPALQATLTDRPAADHDGDGLVDSGEAVAYTVVITNVGGSTADQVLFRISPPVFTQLAVGSVVWPSGATVLSGNDLGDQTVEVLIPNLAPGQSAEIRFGVLVDTNLSTGTVLSAQGTLSAANAPSTLTDDPDTPTLLDPTLTPIDHDPDLSITVEPFPPAAAPGERIHWEINVRNLGLETARRARVDTAVPPHTSFDPAASDPRWSCAGTAGGSPCGIELGTLPLLELHTPAFAVRVVGSLAADALDTTLTATVSDNGVAGPDTNPDNNQASGTAALLGAPELDLAKSGPASARPGDVVAYTLAFANRGDRDGPAAELAETVPPHTTFAAGASSAGWSCAEGAPAGTPCTLALGTLAAGDDSTRIFAVRIDATLPHGAESLTNTARLRDGAGSPPADASATTTLDASPSFQLEKAGPTSASPGELVTFFLGFGNAGDQDAAGVEVSDTVPPHGHFVAAESTAGWSCQDGSPPGTRCTLPVGGLAAGDGSMATFSIRLDPTVPAGLESVINTATVADGDGTPPVSDSATVAIDASPILRVTKTGPASAQPGQTIVYTLTYANEGDQDAAAVELHDTVPAHTTFDAAASSPGWTCPDGAPAGTPCTLALGPLPISTTGSVDFALRLATAVPGDLVAIRNTALLTGGPGDPPDEDEVEVPVDAAPDLRLSKGGPSSASPGDLIGFSLAYANAGDRDAPAATLHETVPQHTTFAAADSTANWSCPHGSPAGTSCILELGPLPAGASGSATFAVRLAASLPAGVTTVRNTALLTGGPDDPPGDDEVEVPVDANAALVLDKRGPATATTGETLVYTLDYANRGDTTAPGATLAETVPAHGTFVASGSSPGWSCPDGAPAGTACTLSVGDLAPGATGTASFAVLVGATAATAGEIVNTATLSDAGGNPPASDTVTTAVDAAPPTAVQLAATLVDTFVEDADGDGRLGAGDFVGYTAVIENLGPAAATGVHFAIAPDPHTELIPESVTTTSGTIDTGSLPGDDHVAVTLGDLAAGARAVVTFEVRLAVPLPAGLEEISAQGHVLSLDTAPTVTDDPDTPEPLDPTVTPLGEDGPPAIVEIPTLHGLGLTALAALLLTVAFRRLRPARSTVR